LAWVGFSSPSVCLHTVDKVFKLSIGNDLAVILEVIWLWVGRSKVKVRVRVGFSQSGHNSQMNYLKVFKLGTWNDLGIS